MNKVYVIFAFSKEISEIYGILYVGNDAKKAAEVFNEPHPNWIRNDIQVWIDGVLSNEEDEEFLALV